MYIFIKIRVRVFSELSFDRPPLFPITPYSHPFRAGRLSASLTFTLRLILLTRHSYMSQLPDPLASRFKPMIKSPALLAQHGPSLDLGLDKSARLEVVVIDGFTVKTPVTRVANPVGKALSNNNAHSIAFSA